MESSESFVSRDSPSWTPPRSTPGSDKLAIDEPTGQSVLENLSSVGANASSFEYTSIMSNRVAPDLAFKSFPQRLKALMSSSGICTFRVGEVTPHLVDLKIP
jgi:hypothetical protein